MNKSIILTNSKISIRKIKTARVIYKGILNIGEKKLPCAVLEDGIRILTSSAIYDIFEKTQRPAKLVKITPNLPTFLDSKNLQPYIDQYLQEYQKLEYQDMESRLKKGYKAEVLPALCDIYLQARKDGVLHQSQLNTADIAEKLMRSFAKVGITALVDEATGYQAIRSQDALQKLLEKYLNREFSTWSKRFPDEFYKQIFRLKGWEINKENFTKRPGIVGTITNEIVYTRLAPEILKELKGLNPKNDLGHRTNKYHQFLTEDIGHDALNKHLHAVIGLMKAFKKWKPFYKVLDRAFPIKTVNKLEKEIA